eukprot:512472-Hanusia_phi.AAC.1
MPPSVLRDTITTPAFCGGALHTVPPPASSDLTQDTTTSPKRHNTSAVSAPSLALLPTVTRTSVARPAIPQEGSSFPTSLSPYSSRARALSE